MTKRSYISRDSSGTHLRAPPRRIRRRSAGQKANRDAHRRATIWWNTLLTTDQRTLWQIYGDHHPRTTRKGKVFRLTAFQSFLSRNLYRAFYGVAPLLDPPDD